MHSVGVAVIGLGIMGSQHASSLAGALVPGGHLAAMCDVDQTRVDAVRTVLGGQVDGVFSTTDPAAAIGHADVAAVLVATPHYGHVELAISALANHRHVLVEKPLAPEKALCEQMIEAHSDPSLVFAAMFNQRTNPRYQRLRGMIRSGELGPLRRIAWTVTDWFRTDAYYRSSAWRATWAGEGGGVLLNQSPHQLDLWQWMFGMPDRVTAFCEFGRYRDIEVEDDVTAYLEYADGCRGVFTTTTGEAPGTNRLEVTGENGKVVIDSADRGLSIWRNDQPMSEFATTAVGGFDQPHCEREFIEVEGEGGQHREVMTNFCAAIAANEPLIAPAAEGIHSVELANAMLLSTFEERPVTVPIDGAGYAAHLAERRHG